MFFIPFIIVVFKKVVVRSDMFKIDVDVSVAFFAVYYVYKTVICVFV